MQFEISDAPEAFYINPYPTYRALREQSPVHVFADGSLFLTRYRDVVACYRDANASSDKQVEFKPKMGDSPLFEHHTTSLVFNDAPLHTRVRRIIMGAVNQRAVVRMDPVVNTLVERLLDDMAAKEDVDVIADFASAIPIEVIGNLLNMPVEDRGPLREWSLAILGALEPTLSEEVVTKGNAAVVDFSDYLRRLIGDRRAKPLDPDEDVLTRLIVGESSAKKSIADDEYRLTEHELIHQCIFMLNAGHETTANLIGNGIWLLTQHPEQQQRLRENPKLIGPAVEEMLRYEGSIQLNNRRLLGTSEIGGKQYGAGTLITLCLGAANRDPDDFDDPETFDIARKPNRHVAFGHSAHACVGMNIARMEGKVAIGRLIERFSNVTLSGEPDRDMRLRFRGFRKLPVKLEQSA